MKRKNQNRVFIVTISAALLLCGCGGSPPEKKAPRGGGQQDGRQQYLELQSENEETDHVANGRAVWQAIWDKKMEPLYVPEKYDAGYVPYLIRSSGDGKQFCYQPWEKEWKDKFKGKYPDVLSYQIINGRSLYIWVGEMSMNLMKYYDNKEKYRDDFYTVRYYLMKIDIETGDMQEIPIPHATYEEIYKRKGEPIPKWVANKREQYWYDIQILSNGNFLRIDDEKNRICDGSTGEEIATLDFEESGDKLLSLVSGEDFFAALTRNPSSHQYTLRLYDDASGTAQYTVPMEIEETENEEGDPMVNIALGASEDSILYIYDKCIYKMDYGEKEFKKVIDPEIDKTFYLSDESYRYSAVCMGKEEDYYVRMEKEGEEMVCHYTKKGEE